MPEVTVTLRQPLALGMRPSVSAPVRTYTHVPGSVLRGALAAAWIRDHGTPDVAPEALRGEFLALFERGVRYGPLLDPKSEVEPISVLRCKYRSKPECEDVRYDEAFGAVPTECESCHHRLEHGHGGVVFRAAGVVERQSVRVALRDDETAQDGALFTRRALTHQDATGDPRVLTGRIIGGTDWLLTRREILLGGRRSTGGSALYDAAPDSAQAAPRVEDRLLVLHLDSPAVLVDGAGRPTDRLDTDHLSEILDVGAKCERQWVRRERVGGWHAASNLPKPDEIAVSAGSVYRLELDDAPDPVGVQTLLDRGIGLRRAEGFGWISVPDRPRPAARTEATASVPPAVSSAADGIVDRLRGSGRERWVRDKLREYREHLAHGGQPNAGILMLPQAEELTPLQHRGLELLLKTGDSVRINAVIERLDAIVRRVAQ